MGRPRKYKPGDRPMYGVRAAIKNSKNVLKELGITATKEELSRIESQTTMNGVDREFRKVRDKYWMKEEGKNNG